MENIFSKILVVVGGVVISFFSFFNKATTTDTLSATKDIPNQVATQTVGEVLGTSTTSLGSSKAYTYDQLYVMAKPKLKTLPLGDNKYVTDKPKLGYIYLCHVNKGSNQGAQADGPWIKEGTWIPGEKAHVEGSVKWPSAWIKNVVSGAKRIITGNNLPVTHTTGVYPIDTNSTAGNYDRNPNSIKTQNMNYSLSASPVYSETPFCMGGEVGVMLSGVPLFNGFDAEERDAQAHEVQDNCDGHPQERGEYHYHGLSSCFATASVTKVLGYALDGFPITGGMVAKDKYLHTENLDICHGLTSTIVVDGKNKTMYHYVMTEDFPYSASCFRGKPISVGGPQGQTPPNLPLERGGTGQTTQVPPQPAQDACKNKSENSSCSIQTPNGNLSGTCNYTPDKKYFACIPTNR